MLPPKGEYLNFLFCLRCALFAASFEERYRLCAGRLLRDMLRVELTQPERTNSMRGSIQGESVESMTIENNLGGREEGSPANVRGLPSIVGGDGCGQGWSDLPLLGLRAIEWALDGFAVGAQGERHAVTLVDDVEEALACGLDIPALQR